MMGSVSGDELRSLSSSQYPIIDSSARPDARTATMGLELSEVL